MVFYLDFFIEKRSNKLLKQITAFLVCLLVGAQLPWTNVLASKQPVTETFYFLSTDSKLKLRVEDQLVTATVDGVLLNQISSPTSKVTLTLKPIWDLNTQQNAIAHQLTAEFQIKLTGFPGMIRELPNREKVKFTLKGRIQPQLAKIEKPTFDYQLEKIQAEGIYFLADGETKIKSEGDLFKMRANLDLVKLQPPGSRSSIALELSLIMSNIKPNTTVTREIGINKKLGKYKVVTFKQLSDYPLKVDDYAKLSTPEGVVELDLNNQIPETILELNGKTVAIEGFMLPVVSEKGWISEFMLLKDTQACCFGVIPELNEWVYIKVGSKGKGVKAKRKVRFLNNVPVIVKGKLLVGSQMDPNTGVNIYVLQADDVAVAKR